MAPLDPQLSRLLQDTAAAPPLDPAAPVAELRAMANAGVIALHPLVRPAIAPVESEDAQIPGPAGPVPVRIYRPTSVGLTAGIHIQLHGGGWWMGDLETHDPMCRELAAASGLTVIAVHYRLAPESRWPAPIDDVVAVIDWLNGPHAAAQGLTPVSLTIGGESAGANISALVALRLRDRGDGSLSGLWLDVPGTDAGLPKDESLTAFGTGYGIEIALVATILPWYVDADRYTDPGVSPAYADVSGLPPVLVTTAEYDPLRDQGERFADQLAAAGVDVTLRRAEGHIHGSAWFTALNPATAERFTQNVQTLVGFHEAARSALVAQRVHA